MPSGDDRFTSSGCEGEWKADRIDVVLSGDIIIGWVNLMNLIFSGINAFYRGLLAGIGSLVLSYVSYHLMREFARTHIRIIEVPWDDNKDITIDKKDFYKNALGG